MAQEPAEILRQAGETVAGMAAEATVAGLFDGRAQFRTDPFVGIRAQYPVVAGLLDAECLLTAETVEPALQNTGAGSFGDGDGGIGGVRVHHHDLIAERQRGQAVADAPGLVERDNARRDARPFDGAVVEDMMAGYLLFATERYALPILARWRRPCTHPGRR